MTTSGVARGREVPRKTLHLLTASVPVGLMLGVPQRAVAAALVALFGVACGIEVARRRSPTVAEGFDAIVGDMLRPHESARGVTGATWLLAAMSLVCLMAPLPAAIAATWAGAVGDSTAAIAGRIWRMTRPGTGKTVAGSTACLLMTALGAWWLAGFSIPAAAGIGAAATLAELPAVAVDDNLRVTLVAAMVATVFLVR